MQSLSSKPLLFGSRPAPAGSQVLESLSAIWLIPSVKHFCLRTLVRWLAQVDSNHRPRAYQARALTTWAMSHHFFGEPPMAYFRVRSPLSLLFSRQYSHSFKDPWDFSLWLRIRMRWWRWWDSNPWPPACRAGALPAELHPHRSNEIWGYISVSFPLP